MSSDLTSAVQDLTNAVQQLTVATQALQASLSSSPGTCGSDYLIEEIAPAYEPERLGEVQAVLSQHTPELGPLEIPFWLAGHIHQKFGVSELGLESQLLRIFSAGYWARYSLDTQVDFVAERPLPGSVVGHWVVLRSPYKVPFRVNNFADFKAFVHPEDKSVIVQGLQSIWEVEVFCLGATSLVPALWRPSKPQ